MSKISLTKAKDVLKEIEIKDVFASLISNKLIEDEIILQTYINLTNKIHRAEKSFEIDNIKHNISLLSEKEKYYRPSNSVFYYKDAISLEVKDSNRDIWNELKNDISKLEDTMEHLSDHIFIEV